MFAEDDLDVDQKRRSPSALTNRQLLVEMRLNKLNPKFHSFHIGDWVEIRATAETTGDIKDALRTIIDVFGVVDGVIVDNNEPVKYRVSGNWFTAVDLRVLDQQEAHIWLSRADKLVTLPGPAIMVDRETVRKFLKEGVL